jgi:hypothetical protein
MLIASILNPQQTARTGLPAARQATRSMSESKRRRDQIEISSGQRIRHGWESAQWSRALIARAKSWRATDYKRPEPRILARSTTYVLS